MLKTNSSFDYRKATQELNFFAQKEGGEINKLKALKLVYLADRYHLRKYGRLITNDTYFAMKLGPVPSGVKDLAEVSEFLGEEEASYSIRFISQTSNLILRSTQAFESNVFSDSDIEALNYVWDKFGHLEPFALANLTHQYPDWKKHQEELELGSRIQMDIIDFFDDPDCSIDKLFELDEKDKNLRREEISEHSHLESLWR
jgi:uncharacterized phage-associated protein